MHLGCFSLCTRHDNYFQAAAMLPPFYIMSSYNTKPSLSI